MWVIGGGVLGRWVVGLGRCVVAPSGSERVAAMEWMPCLVRSETPGGAVRVGVGHEVVDGYLEFLAARCRPNTVLAAGFDLKVFFTTVPKDPTEVSTADVLGFITAQRCNRGSDGGAPVGWRVGPVGADDPTAPVVAVGHVLVPGGPW